MSKFTMSAGEYTYTSIDAPNGDYVKAIVTGYSAAGYGLIVCAFAPDYEPSTKTVRTLLAALAGCKPSEVE